jgi:hypothetical protein
MKTISVTRIPARWIACLALLAWSFPALADKTDVVHLRNGDRVTCEIKKLERGQLKVSTDSMGTIYIEWKDVVGVTSKELYVIEMQDGSRVQGTLAETDTEGQLLLSGPGIRIERASTGAAGRATAPGLTLERRAGRATVGWDQGAYPLAVIRDAATGQILSLARGGSIELPDAPTELEVTVSDGTRGMVSRLR